MEEIEAICLSFVKNTSFISSSRPLFQPFCFQLILCLAFLFIVNSNVEMFIAKALHHHIATSSRQIHYPFDSMMMRCQCYRYKDFVHFSENLCEERQREKKDKTFLFCFFFLFGIAIIGSACIWSFRLHACYRIVHCFIETLKRQRKNCELAILFGRGRNCIQSMILTMGMRAHRRSAHNFFFTKAAMSMFTHFLSVASHFAIV